MKKALAISLVLFLAGTMLFAANTQKIYPVGSEIFQTIKNIYILSGYALPSTTGPWSADELRKMLEKIPESQIPEFLQASYQELLQTLNEEPEQQWRGIGSTFSNELNLQLGYHTNNDSLYSRTDKKGIVEKLFIGRNAWSSDLLHTIEPTYRMNWETWAADKFYAFFEFGLFNSYHGNTTNDYGVKNLSNNIFMFQNLAFEPAFMDANFPYRGFVATGGENWTVQVGRDRLSWGAGKTGNLSMSDNFPYHDMARFTTYSNKYKYTFLMSNFAHPQNYYQNGDMRFKTGQEGLDGFSMYIAHRIEGRFAKDGLNLSLTEAIMYESKTNHLDLAVINPVFIYHNSYTPDVANSTLEFEADFTLLKGFNVYGQAIVDEFAIPLIEESASPTVRETPNRYGVLGGITYVTGLSNGIVTANVEFAQINPYTYLRYNSKTDEQTSYGLDYVVPIRQWSTAAGGVTYDDTFLGYTYGPDSRVFNVHVGYTRGKLALSANFLSVEKGTHDQWTKTGSIGGQGEQQWEDECTTPTTGHEFENWRYADAQSRNAVQKTMDIGISASYQLLDNLKVYGQFDYISIKNAYNIQGQDDSDIQIVAGLKYSF